MEENNMKDKMERLEDEVEDVKGAAGDVVTEAKDEAFNRAKGIRDAMKKKVHVTTKFVENVASTEYRIEGDTLATVGVLTVGTILALVAKNFKLSRDNKELEEENERQRKWNSRKDNINSALNGSLSELRRIEKDRDAIINRKFEQE